MALGQQAGESLVGEVIIWCVKFIFRKGKDPGLSDLVTLIALQRAGHGAIFAQS